MRVSVNPSDAGYQGYLRLGGSGAAIRVFLDDVELRHCVTADSKLGSVTILETDKSGRFVLTARGNAAKWKRLFGRVEIKAGRNENRSESSGA